MRILMLGPRGGLGGPMPRIVDLLVQSLRELGCDVATASWGRRADDEGLASKLFRRPGDILQVRRIASGFRPDLVVVHTSLDWPSIVRDVALAAAIRAPGRSLVLQMHGGLADRLASPGNRPLKRATAVLLRLIDGTLVLSSEEVQALTSFDPTGRFERVANPFQPHHAAAEVRELGPGDEASLLFVGRLLPEKGAIDVIHALAQLSESRPARLVLAGSGPAERDVTRAVDELALGEKVVLAGRLSPRQLTEAYERADAFVFPTYHPEGFPTVIAEAMAAGLPIVTTRTRGSADHLEEGVNALFVPPRDPGALARALERLLEDHELRKRMADANRAAVERFEPDRVAREYLAALSRLAG